MTAAAVAVPAAAAAMCVFALVVVGRQHGGVARVPVWLPWAAWAGSLAGLIGMLIVGVRGLAGGSGRRALADRVVGLNAGDLLLLKAWYGSVATAGLCALTSAVVWFV